MPVVSQGSDEASLPTQGAATQRRLQYEEEESQLYGFSGFPDKSSRERIAEATVFLQPLNSILEAANCKLLLEPLATQGDGYCFFYVAAGVCGMDVSQTAARQVFACALEASCSEPDVQDRFERNEVELKQRVAELLVHEEYGSELMLRSPFELSVMDKFEALVTKKRMLDTRQYGDTEELLALLRRAGATFLKLDVTDRTDHLWNKLRTS